MNKVWNPNAQMAALQFSGLVSLLVALQLFGYITVSAVAAIAPDHGMLQTNILEYFRVIPVILGIAFLLHYLRTVRKLKVPVSWQSTLMIFKDEYTLRIYRIAASRSLAFFYPISLLVFFLSTYDVQATWLASLMTVDIVVAGILLITSIVFGITTLFYLYSEEA